MSPHLAYSPTELCLAQPSPLFTRENCDSCDSLHDSLPVHHPDQHGLVPGEGVERPPGVTLRVSGGIDNMYTHCHLTSITPAPEEMLTRAYD